MCNHDFHKTGECEWEIDEVIRLYHVYECKKCELIEERKIK